MDLRHLPTGNTEAGGARDTRSPSTRAPGDASCPLFPFRVLGASAPGGGVGSLGLTTEDRVCDEQPPRAPTNTPFCPSAPVDESH